MTVTADRSPERENSTTGAGDLRLAIEPVCGYPHHTYNYSRWHRWKNGATWRQFLLVNGIIAEVEEEREKAHEYDPEPKVDMPWDLHRRSRVQGRTVAPDGATTTPPDTLLHV